MKWIRPLSIVLSLLSVVIAYQVFYGLSVQSNKALIKENKISDAHVKIGKVAVTIEEAAKDAESAIDKAAQDIGKKTEKPAASDKEREIISRKLLSLRGDIEIARAKIEKMTKAESTEIQVPANVQPNKINNMPNAEIAETQVPADVQSNKFVTLMAKLGFSLIFGLSALFVILSKKYEEDTEKWAFSILSLISGVWIGTI